MSFRVGFAGLLLLLAPLAGCDAITSPQVVRTTIRLSTSSSGAAANGHSSNGWISDDGTAVAFLSKATNLVQDQTNSTNHLYVKNRVDGSVRLATRNSDAGDLPVDCSPSAPFLSGTGRYVVFVAMVALDTGAAATGTANIFVRDTELNLTYRAIDRNLWPNADCGSPGITDNGRFVVFSTASTNIGFPTATTPQVYVSDLSTSPPTIHLVSKTNVLPNGPSNGDNGQCSISSDGIWICYSSNSTNIADADPIYDIYLAFFDYITVSASSLISINPGGVKGDGDSSMPHMSPDGKHIAFATVAPNMGVGPMNIMVWDGTTTTTSCKTITSDGLGPNGLVMFPRVTRGGDGVVFLSNASNLTGNASGLFQPYIVTTLGFEQVSVGDTGALASTPAGIGLSISSGGLWVVWESDAGNLVVPDSGGFSDIFARGPFDR